MIIGLLYGCLKIDTKSIHDKYSGTSNYSERRFYKNSAKVVTIMGNNTKPARKIDTSREAIKTVKTH